MKTTNQITTELSNLNSLLAKYPNIPSPPGPGMPGYVAPVQGKILVGTATIKGAIQGLSPNESYFDIALSDPNTADDGCTLGGKCMAFAWAHDLSSLDPFNQNSNLPPPKAPSEIIATNIG